MIGFVINLTYNLSNPFLMLIIELMQYITIYFKGPFADERLEDVFRPTRSWVGPEATLRSGESFHSLWMKFTPLH
jgi:hypothetical protein